jgi:CheY-like chemotaxis protein
MTHLRTRLCVAAIQTMLTCAGDEAQSWSQSAAADQSGFAPKNFTTLPHFLRPLEYARSARRPNFWRPGCIPSGSEVFSSETARKYPRMKILLVDDHALIRDALRGVLKELAPEATVLEAADSRQAMRLVEAHPDLHLMLLDLNLPDRDGFAVLTDLRRRHATISLVVLSASQDRDSILKAIDLGALGFIPKSSPRDVMANALRLIFSGGIYIPPEALAPTEFKEHARQRPISA